MRSPVRLLNRREAGEKNGSDGSPSGRNREQERTWRGVRKGREKAAKTMSARSSRQTEAGTAKEFNRVRFSPWLLAIAIGSQAPWAKGKKGTCIHGRARAVIFASRRALREP